ncbi:porin [Gemmatimonadota bacterium]
MFRRMMSVAAILVAVVALAQPAAAQVGGNGTLAGRAYFDLTKGMSNANEDVMTFGFRRIYFTYNMTMSDNVKGRFRTDVKQDADGKVRVFMKHAYADWAVNDQFRLRFGQQGTILFGTIEDVWGYRHLEKTLEDLYKVRSSADFGISGSIKAGEAATVNVMMSNGEGYDKNEDSAFRKAYEAQGVFTPIEGLTVSAHYGLNGYDTDGDPATTGDQDNTSTMDLGVGYEGENYAVGGSFFNAANFGGADNVDASGFWGFGRYSFADSPLGLVGTYMSFDPDVDTNDDEETLMILGLDYSPGSGMNIIPNYRSETVGGGDAVNSFVITFYWKW